MDNFHRHSEEPLMSKVKKQRWNDMTKTKPPWWQTADQPEKCVPPDDTLCGLDCLPPDSRITAEENSQVAQRCHRTPRLCVLCRPSASMTRPLRWQSQVVAMLQSVWGCANKASSPWLIYFVYSECSPKRPSRGRGGAVGGVGGGAGWII